MYDCYGRVLSHRQPLIQLRYCVYLAPPYLVPIDITRAHRSDVGEAFRKCSIYETENTTRRSAADRGFHHSRRRGRADVHGTVGHEQRPEPALKSLEQLLEG